MGAPSSQIAPTMLHVHASPSRVGSAAANPPLLDQLEERTFRWFCDIGNPANGLAPDRWPSRSASTRGRSC
jgi:hypothetical protein